MNNYFIYNVNTHHTVKDTNGESLRSLNQRGYNIYRVLNEFGEGLGRKIDDLLYLKLIGIDLDSKNTPLATIVADVYEKFGIQPYIATETYKGYHLLFRLSPELYLLSIESYEKLFDTINSYIGGDKNMRSVTGVLKMSGYIDNKMVDGVKRDYIIKEVYRSEREIDVSTAQRIIGPLEYDREREDSIKKKVEKNKKKKISKEERKNRIESIDARKLIDAVKSSGKDVEVAGNSIIGTDGLKLHYDDSNDRWKIVDFTDNGRYGNYNFLCNYICKGMADKEKWKFINKVISKFGISLNTSFKHKIPLFFITIFIEGHLYNIDGEVVSREERIQLFRLFTILYAQIGAGISNEIKRSDILKLMGLSYRSSNLKKIDTLLVKLSGLQTINNNTHIIYTLFEHRIISKGGETYVKYIIPLKNTFNSLKLFNGDLLSCNDKQFFLAMYLYYNKGVYTTDKGVCVMNIKISDIMSLLGLKNTPSMYKKLLSNYLQLMINMKVIFKYKKNKDKGAGYIGLYKF